MIVQGLYKGFSSHEFQRTGSFRINDIELVKLDLLNHIFTSKGSRIMMPTFGTQIPDLVFEPLDETTLTIIRTELRTVFEFDPRVELLELEIVPDEPRNAVTAAARLKYIELNIIDMMNLNIDVGGSS